MVGAPADLPGPSARPARVLLTSWWVLYRVMRASLKQRVGGPLSYLLNLFFALGIGAQVCLNVWEQTQRQRLLLQAPESIPQAAGEAAALFLADVLGMLLLLTPAMIRADGIAGKRRAAVDTELWLTLPLSGQQRVVARLGQATFFLTFLGVFLLSHFLSPALSFARSLPGAVLLFLLLAMSALLLILGGGVAGYSLVRRHLPPHRQGQLVAWAGVALLPLSYAFFGLGRGKGGALGAVLAGALVDSPVAALLRAFHDGRPAAALVQAGLLLCGALGLAAIGWRATEILGREAVDDLVPLGAARRYPHRQKDEHRPLSHLRKDLLVRWRDPTHRGALIGSAMASLLVVVADMLSGGQAVQQFGQTATREVVLALSCFAVGLSVLVAAGQWLPIEARTIDWLRVSGVEPTGLLVRKGLSASVEAIVLSLPVCVLLVVRAGARMVPYLSVLMLFAVGLAWFMVGDTAARFPQGRRDTRPVQLRSLYAGYLVMLCATIAMPVSLRAAAAALALLGMGALGRVDAGIDALVYLDEAPSAAPRRVRFADAWLCGAAALVIQGLVALLLYRVLQRRYDGHVPQALILVVAYSAFALVLGLWSVTYLRERLGAGLRELLGPPRTPGGYLWGLLLGLVSCAVALGYVKVLPVLLPGPGIDLAGAGLPTRGLSPGLGVALAVVLCLVDPLAEETFFRGWILRGLDERVGPRLGLWLQALLFMLLHPALSYVPVGVLGVLCGVAVRRTGSIRPAILVHMIHNGLPALTLLFGKAT